ncbi:transcriptional regulator PefI, partial [Salmonella enterica subsp. enterica serovar Typhi]|nr:transcriptional regulator PefI [Salmonella enterica subsp. enterica serovar Typhi]
RAVGVLEKVNAGKGAPGLWRLL